jgi:hypothetical protein
MNGNDESERLAEVIEDAPAETNGRNYRAEIVIEQHDRRRLARNVRSAASHRHSDVSGL